MRLTVLGCSPAYPNPGGRSSGYLLTRESGTLLLDCGHGVAGALRATLPLERLDAILLTHMHADHFFDLVPLHYALELLGLRVPLWLPPGGESALEALRIALSLADGFFAGTYELHEYDPDDALDVSVFSLRFAPTRHYIPAYAIRANAGDGTSPSLFFSSDTGWTDALVPLAHGADLALVECGAVDGPEPGHMTGELVGTFASDSAVKRLVVTHYEATHADAILADIGSHYHGPVTLAFDGATYDV
jgi:ribonuclease BN (tRNA processing enzyme)